MNALAEAIGLKASGISHAPLKDPVRLHEKCVDEHLQSLEEAAAKAAAAEAASVEEADAEYLRSFGGNTRAAKADKMAVALAASKWMARLKRLRTVHRVAIANVAAAAGAAGADPDAGVDVTEAAPAEAAVVEANVLDLVRSNVVCPTAAHLFRLLDHLHAGFEIDLAKANPDIDYEVIGRVSIVSCENGFRGRGESIPTRFRFLTISLLFEHEGRSIPCELQACLTSHPRACA